MKNSITPFLWFKDSAEDAAAFYHSVFNKNKGTGLGESNPMATEFEINGQHFVALNGNPGFEFNESVSFMISCQTQEEVDYYWSALGKGGEEQQCGWLKDKYGVSWQVIPDVLGKYLQDKDRVKADRVLKAMLKMVKIDISKLEAAYRS